MGSCLPECLQKTKWSGKSASEKVFLQQYLENLFRSLDLQIGHAAGEMYTIFIFRAYAPPALGADLRPWMSKIFL
jgi:hypothetical protein